MKTEPLPAWVGLGPRAKTNPGKKLACAFTRENLINARLRNTSPWGNAQPHSPKGGWEGGPDFVPPGCPQPALRDKEALMPDARQSGGLSAKSVDALIAGPAVSASSPLIFWPWHPARLATPGPRRHAR